MILGPKRSNRGFIPEMFRTAALVALPAIIVVIAGNPCSCNSHLFCAWQLTGRGSLYTSMNLMHASGNVHDEQPDAYIIIVGAFKSFENAERFVIELKAKGYDAYIAGRSENGLFRVSIHSSMERKKAFRELALIRAGGFPDAWLLGKPGKEYQRITHTSTATTEKVPRIPEIPAHNLPEPGNSVFKTIDIDDNTMCGQYQKLKEALNQYREIEKNGGWPEIDLDSGFSGYKPGDTARAILQVREHLFITGDLKHNDQSNRYDTALYNAMSKYRKRNGLSHSDTILPDHILNMNVSVGERIRKLTLNMERCRQISAKFAQARKVILVNIPAFTLYFIREGKVDLCSPVIVGDHVTKTVIMSSMLTSVVFCPYWYLPQSIIDKYVRQGMAKNKDFLEERNMEWNNGNIRQKPGKYNTLGLIKFVFPNAEEIYIHDTPIKSLYKEEVRAFSHGCIRVKKSRDLAIAVLKDEGWTAEDVDAAMKAGKESTCILKNQVPVYIGYFTAWVDEQGSINFYDDIYHWDGNLSRQSLNAN